MKEIKSKSGRVCLVDDEDFDRVSKIRWSSHVHKNTVYFRGHFPSSKGKMIYSSIHRFILGVTDPKIIVDHIDKDGCNNQKSNLRLCNTSENSANRRPRKHKRSQYFGVSFYSDITVNKWRAQIQKNKKSYYLGCFATEIEAAKAYDLKAKELHGEFANLNFK